ncbi:response regulator transcription factor [Nocardia asteroides]
MTTDIILLETPTLVRCALVALLEQESDIRVVGSVGSSEEMLDLAEGLAPALAVVGLDLLNADAVTIAEDLHSRVPGCASLLLGSSPSWITIRRAFTGKVGGLVLKDSAPSHLIDAIRQVAKGQRVFDADVTVAAWRNEGCVLTDREVAVLDLAARGNTVAEIADSVRLSEGTVRNYLYTSVSKLGARNRLDAVRIAREAHWI